MKSKSEKEVLAAEIALINRASRPLDQILYEAYCEGANWKGAVFGVTLPPWERVQPDVKKAWRAVADAAMDWAYEQDIETSGFTVIPAKGFDATAALKERGEWPNE